MVSSKYISIRDNLNRTQTDEANFIFAPTDPATVDAEIASQRSAIEKQYEDITANEERAAAYARNPETRSEVQNVRNEINQIRTQINTRQRRIETLEKVKAGTTPGEIERERESTVSNIRFMSNPSSAVGYNAKTGRVEIGAGDPRGTVVSISKAEEQMRAQDLGYTKSSTIDSRTDKFFRPVNEGIMSPGLKAKPSREAAAEYNKPQKPRIRAESGVTEKLFENIISAPTAPTSTPRKDRAKAAQGVKEKLFANPNFILDRSQPTAKPTLEGFAPSVKGQIKTSKRVTKDYTLSLTENISTEKQRVPQSFGVSLVEGTPAKPRDLTQADVDKMSPEQYAIYKAEIDNYNRFVANENKRIKKENTESLNKSLRGLKTFIDEQKAAGTKTIVINTDQGEKRVPIGEAYLAIQRTKNVKGIYTDQVIPEGYTVAGLSNMVFVEAPQKTVGPEPTPYFAEQVKIERFTGLDLGGLAPITKGIDTIFETKKPVEGRSELNQRLTGVAAPFVNIGTITYDTGKAIAKEIRKPGSGFEFRGTDIATGGNPLNLPYARSETPTQRTAFGTLLEGKLPDITRPYEQGTIAGDIGLAALGAVRLKGSKPKATEEQIGQLPEEMRKPKTEAPSNLNDLYKPIPRLAKTPNQKFLEEIQMSETARKAMAERSRQISDLGADYAKLRYDVAKGRIDLEQIGVRLGQGKVTTMRGKPNPRWEKSGEAPESTMLREAQQRNIRENQRRTELDNILSEGAMKRMSPEKEFSVYTEKEIQGLKEKNVEDNIIGFDKERLIQTDVKAALLERAGFTSEAKANLGQGRPKIFRQKEGEIFEATGGSRKTYIEKVEEMRRNPELEEREPFKFYVKKELGYADVTEPIDLSGRLDLGFQKLKYGLGEGTGTLIKKDRFDAYTENELRGLKEKNVEDNIRKSERQEKESGILSQDTMRKLSPEKEKEFSVYTEKEIQGLKEKNVEDNIKRSNQPRLLNKEMEKPVAQKLDLQSQINQDLASKAGFKSTKVGLGKGKVQVIKTGMTGSALVGPMPFLGKVIAEEVPPGIPPLTNTTETNQTEDLPPDGGIISAPAAQTTTQSNQNINAIVGRQGFTSEQISLGRGRTSRRTFSQSAARPASDSRRRLATIPLNQPKAGQERKQRSLIIQQRVTALAQPTPNPSIPGLRPGQPFSPIQPPALKTTLLTPPRRPPRIPPAFRPKRKKEAEKRKLKELKPNDFLGNASQENISSNYSRQEIILGIKRTAKIERNDLAKERKGVPRFVNTSTNPMLSRTKPGLLRKEKKALSL